jgi:hypothetical protein
LFKFVDEFGEIEIVGDVDDPVDSLLKLLLLIKGDFDCYLSFIVKFKFS